MGERCMPRGQERGARAATPLLCLFMYSMQVNDEELQTEPLVFKLWDYDTLSQNDTIGSVGVDLNPLLRPNSAEQVLVEFPNTPPPLPLLPSLE